jgi:ABC-2 type transport system ATP-binding protein
MAEVRVGTIEVRGLTKHFGAVVAAREMSFDVRPGRICAFLGPNGAGKTTALRMMLGLVQPTAGTVRFDGARYVDLPYPRRTVGALLEANGFHPGRRARDHLFVLAHASGIDFSRIDEALELVGLTDAARRRVGGFSLGMRQRLGLAGALLGDPQFLLLDEPANGLDPEGIAWLRRLLRERADAGAGVVVSSHVLSEVEQIADDVIIVSDGKVRYTGPLHDIAGEATSLETAFLRLTMAGEHA